MISRKASMGVVVIVTVLVAIAFSQLPPVSQPQSYHQFADTRRFLGVPNFCDVVSNLPFVVIGRAEPTEAAGPDLS